MSVRLWTEKDPEHQGGVGQEREHDFQSLESLGLKFLLGLLLAVLGFPSTRPPSCGD